MKMAKKITTIGIAVLATVGPALSAHAGKLSWFDNAPFAGVGALGVPDASLHSLSNRTTSFGLNLYRSQSITTDDAYSQDDSESVSDAGSLHVYGEIESTPSSSLLGSVQDREDKHQQDTLNRRVNALGLKWQHRLNALNTFAVSAEYGEGVTVYPRHLIAQKHAAADA